MLYVYISVAVLFIIFLVLVYRHFIKQGRKICDLKAKPGTKAHKLCIAQEAQKRQGLAMFALVT